MKNPTKLIQKLFESRQIAHEYHLKTLSYAKHKALEEYYEGILNLIDDFIETYQGQYGIIENYLNIENNKKEDVLIYFKNFIIEIRNLKNDSINDTDTHLQNIIDEIYALTYKTIYKLEFLM